MLCRISLGVHLVEFLSLSNANADGNVGTIPASFHVGDDGSATYSIPIEQPPSPTDMRPEVSLSYTAIIDPMGY